jgi:hypothetical protein
MSAFCTPHAMKRAFLTALIVLSLGAAAPEMCADSAMLVRVRAEEYEAPATRKDRLEHELYALRMLALKTPVVTPHRETVAFDVDRRLPSVFELGVLRGQELRVELSGVATSTTDVRAGVFAHDGVKMRRIAVARGNELLRTRVFWTGPHYLVLEPGTHVSGLLDIHIDAGASIFFPVKSKDSRAIKSFWGDRRDGGRRSHQGVDIFAPKGTAALAAVDGVVEHVGYSTLGGKVVWLSDRERRRFFYYAHLDEFEALEGSEVKAGDVLGYVGNTGNARSTPPHLHFGIYAPSAVDPFPYVHEPGGTAKKITAKTNLIGSTVRTAAKTTSVFASPDAKSTMLRTLERGSLVRVIGASAAFYRVIFDDATVGYVRSGDVRALETAA